MNIVSDGRSEKESDEEQEQSKSFASFPLRHKLTHWIGMMFLVKKDQQYIVPFTITCVHTFSTNIELLKRHHCKLVVVYNYLWSAMFGWFVENSWIDAHILIVIFEFS